MGSYKAICQINVLCPWTASGIELFVYTSMELYCSSMVGFLFEQKFCLEHETTDDVL